MDIVKKAQQRARRLTRGFTSEYKALAAGTGAIFNDAVERFNKSMRLIRESELTTSEKRKLREEVSRRFIESGESTRTEIKENYERKKKYISQRAKEAIQDDVELMAKYLDSSKNQKISMLASFYLSSDQIMLIRDRLYTEGYGTARRGASNERIIDDDYDNLEFYKRLDDAIYEKFRNRELPTEELNYYLMTEKY